MTQKYILLFFISIFLSSCSEKSIIDTELGNIRISPNRFIVKDTTYHNNKSIKQLKFIQSDSEYFWVNFYNSGKKKSIHRVKNGQSHGEYIDWFENGKIEWERNYDNGIQVGESKIYFANGNLKTLDNNNTSEQTEYYDTGIPKETRSGKKLIIYYADGAIKESFLIISKEEITVEYYNQNTSNVFKGRYISDTLYKDDRKYTGKIISYFSNNEISHFENIIDGLPDGKSYSKHGNGTMKFKGGFYNGKPIGDHIHYYDNGNKNSVKNSENKTYKSWDEEGNPI